MLDASGFLCDSPQAEILQAAFQLFSVIALGCFTQVSIASLLLSILGPRLALHGPPGSMHRSVDSLTMYRKHTSYALTAGLFAFFISAGIHPWLYSSNLAALPASVAVLVGAIGTALSMRTLTLAFRLPKEGMIFGYYGTHEFEPRSLRGSSDHVFEPRTPGRFIAHVQSEILPNDPQRTRRPWRRPPKLPPIVNAPPAGGRFVGTTQSSAASSPPSCASSLLANVPPHLGQEQGEQVLAGSHGGGCATTGTELTSASSWWSRRPTAFAPRAASSNALQSTTLVGLREESGRLHGQATRLSPASSATAVPPVVRASTSFEIMMRAEALEEQGRFREAAELLALKMEQLHAAQRGAYRAGIDACPAQGTMSGDAYIDQPHDESERIELRHGASVSRNRSPSWLHHVAERWLLN
mmetsp:Transcript_14568/g.44503  ORF Transcript_14568/g.44503 Transcript_14568/m.44503 type:complete len:412 (-) Transcript_14568:212-1447(-)